MSKYSIKHFLLAISYLAIASASLADNPQQAPGGATNAIAFGIQAGQIAGAAQACGIDISTFTVRVNEAVNKLALSSSDKLSAIDSFQKTLGQTQAIQATNHPIPCSQVTQDFSSLPLLRADYEQSVISQLNPGMAGNTNSASNTQNQTQQSNTMTSQQNQQNNTANQQNTQSQQNTQNPQQTNNANNTQGNTSNPSANNNPAYGSPNNNYGAYTPSRNTYDNAINSLNTTNQQSLQAQGQASGSSSQPINTNTQQNTMNTQTNTTNTNNNPPPPSYTNPNNTVPTAITGGY